VVGVSALRNSTNSRPVTGLEWTRGFQEVKVPRFHDNGPRYRKVVRLSALHNSTNGCCCNPRLSSSSS